MAAYFCVVRGTVCLPRRREGPRLIPGSRSSEEAKRSGEPSVLTYRGSPLRFTYGKSDAVRPVIVDEAAVGDDLPLVVRQVAEGHGELLLRAVGTEGQSPDL